MEDLYGPGIQGYTTTATLPYQEETEQQAKQRIVLSIISQLAELEQQAQVSVMRSVAAFYGIEAELEG